MKVSLPVRKSGRLDMLPLIDVVFLLLVFFIYVMLSMTAQRGIHVELPTSSTAEKSQEKVMSVTVKKNGDIFVDKELTALDVLSETLRSKTVNPDTTGVLIFGDKELTYQRLFRVIDQIKGSGIYRVSLQAEAETK